MHCKSLYSKDILIDSDSSVHEGSYLLFECKLNIIYNIIIKRPIWSLQAPMKRLSSQPRWPSKINLSSNQKAAFFQQRSSETWASAGERDRKTLCANPRTTPKQTRHIICVTPTDCELWNNTGKHSGPALLPKCTERRFPLWAMTSSHPPRIANSVTVIWLRCTLLKKYTFCMH